MNPDYKEKTKVFLTKRLKEYEKKIIVMKRNIRHLYHIIDSKRHRMCHFSRLPASSSNLHSINLWSPGHRYFTKI